MKNNKTGSFWTCRNLLFSDMWLNGNFDKGKAYLDLTGLASYKDELIETTNGRLIGVFRGQLAWSISNLSKRWHWTKRQTTRFLNELEIDGEIDQCRTNSTTIITMTKYNQNQPGNIKNVPQNAPQNKKQAKVVILSTKTTEFSDKKQPLKNPKIHQNVSQNASHSFYSKKIINKQPPIVPQIVKNKSRGVHKPNQIQKKYIEQFLQIQEKYVEARLARGKINNQDSYRNSLWKTLIERNEIGEKPVSDFIESMRSEVNDFARKQKVEAIKQMQLKQIEKMLSFSVNRSQKTNRDFTFMIENFSDGSLKNKLVKAKFCGGVNS